MINIRESKTFYVVRNTVITDTVEAENKDQVRDIEINERGVHNMDKKKIYDANEFYDALGYYPEDFFLVKDGKAIDSVNALDIDMAKMTFDEEMGWSISEDCEVLSYNDFYSKYNHDPISDIGLYEYDDDEEDDGNMVDEYGYDWSKFGRKHGDEDSDYSPSAPWNAPGMSVEDFI